MVKYFQLPIDMMIGTIGLTNNIKCKRKKTYTILQELQKLKNIFDDAFINRYTSTFFLLKF